MGICNHSGLFQSVRNYHSLCFSPLRWNRVLQSSWTNCMVCSLDFLWSWPCTLRRGRSVPWPAQAPLTPSSWVLGSKISSISTSFVELTRSHTLEFHSRKTIEVAVSQKQLASLCSRKRCTCYFHTLKQIRRGIVLCTPLLSTVRSAIRSHSSAGYLTSAILAIVGSQRFPLIL